MSRNLLECQTIARRIATQASARVAELYAAYRAGGSADTLQKEGDGPVTIADREANAIIKREVGNFFPQDAILSEEDPDSWITSGEWTWMIDPVDGTEEFLKANGEFMVMIGLCHRGVPVVGVVEEPATGYQYYATKGHGAFFVEKAGAAPHPLKVSSATTLSELTLAVSRSHRSPRVEAFMKETSITRNFISGSVGRKIAVITTGKADVYLHPSPGTKLWDTCAPQVILEEAGGIFRTALGDPIPYVRSDGDVKNEQGLLACSPGVYNVLLAASKTAWEVPLPPRASKRS